MSREETKYTYFRVDFEDWPEDFDYTIVATIREVAKLIKFAEIHLDDPDRKCKVIITGVGMTKKEFREFKKTIINPQ